MTEFRRDLTEGFKEVIQDDQKSGNFYDHKFEIKKGLLHPEETVLMELDVADEEHDQVLQHHSSEISKTESALFHKNHLTDYVFDTPSLYDKARLIHNGFIDVTPKSTKPELNQKLAFSKNRGYFYKHAEFLEDE